MKVRELIELLQGQDQDAEVLLVEQPNWPFEHAIQGITNRHSMIQNERYMRGEDDESDTNDACPEGTSPTDVFIVEGRNIRYGSKAAWTTVER